MNEYYDIHKGELIKIKKVITDAKDNYKSHMKRKDFQYHSTKVYSEMLNSISKHNPNIPEVIDESIAQIDLVIQDLDYDKETKPLKLMGVTCSNELMVSIYTGAASLAFAISQILWSQYSE